MRAGRLRGRPPKPALTWEQETERAMQRIGELAHPPVPPRAFGAALVRWAPGVVAGHSTLRGAA
jgi:hypothetical protein